MFTETVAGAIVILIKETGSVHVLEEDVVDVVALVTVQVMAVLTGAAPHEDKLRRMIGDTRQIRSLTAHRSGSPGLIPGNTAILWLNVDPVLPYQKLYRNLSGRKATTTNPHLS